jgi:hypothetical protein
LPALAQSQLRPIRGDRASSSAWGYYELATSHLPHITHPTELSAVLLDLVG